jgi:hypothetical protein
MKKKAKVNRHLQAQLKKGVLCYCGERAVKHDNAGWACASCLKKEAAYYFQTRARRGDTGFRRMIDAYKVSGLPQS